MAANAVQEEDLDASLYPIAVLLDELKHEDLQLRLNAIRRIKTIAEALGPERTRGELLPFITETIDDEDEVLTALADELSDFLDEVGGPAHAAVLLHPLETLITVEESIVRDRAVNALSNLLTAVAAQSATDAFSLQVDHMFPLVQRLATADWFTSRISACSLLSRVHHGLPEDRTDLKADVRSLFKRLARDETPMVRRAAACNIANFAEAVHVTSPPLVRSEILPIFSSLVDDEQDSVRLLIVENAADFATLLAQPASNANTDHSDVVMSADANGAPASDPNQSSSSSTSDPSATPAAAPAANDAAATPNAEGSPPAPAPGTENGQQPNATHSRAPTEKILEMVRTFSSDKSWRVRYMVADQLANLCDALGPAAVRSHLLPAFMVVLKDSEPEVRTAAALNVTELVKRLVALPAQPGASTGVHHAVNDVLPVVVQLVEDSAQHVRAALASNIMGLAPVLGAEVTMSHLVNVVLSLLKDDFPDVRLNVISRLDKVSFVMSIDRLSSELLPAIVQLAEDKNWRVRLAIIERIPLLASQLGKDYFKKDSKLGDLCIKWLVDCVYSIREAAINNLKKLTEVFELEWAKEHIVPQVLSMYDNSTNYLLRMTSLHAIGVLSQVVGAETVEQSFLPIVTERASRDPVPNVRFCSAKTLNLVIPFVRQDVRESKIRPCLMTLIDAAEKDTDVNYFAQQALQKLGSCPS